MLRKLSAKEYEYMCFIWKHPEGIMSNELYSHFDQAPGTIGTLLHRIHAKGLVSTKKIEKNVLYTPTMTKQEYDRWVEQMRIKKIFGMNSIEHFIAAFYGKEKLTPHQAGKLNALLEELENEQSE